MLELSPEILNTIATILDKYGKAYVEEAKNNLEREDATASGRLYDSIEFRTEVLSREVSLEISMEDYAEFVDEGRSPGSFPPIDAIKEWIRDKGLTYQSNSLTEQNLSLEQQNNSLAYLIGRKIEEEGTPATNFLPTFELDLFAEELGEELTDEIAQQVLDHLGIEDNPNISTQ